MSFLLTILAFALCIGPLVFVHELGHYLAGRWFGVKAEVFSIGFGQEVAGFTDRRGTRWKFGWLPLGGYVRFAGDMNPASVPDANWLSLPVAERQQTFQAKKLWQRAIIVAAGPITNFIVAILILAGFALAYGDVRTSTEIGVVGPKSAAEVAGLKTGDRITALNGNSVDTFDDLVRFIVLRPSETIRVDYVRDGAPARADVKLGVRIERDRFGNEYQLGLLGVGPGEPVVEPVGLLQAIPIGVRRTGDTVTMMVDTLAQIITGRRPVSQLGGPLSIADAAGSQLSLGWPEFIGLMAMISINLGFINLLPLPILDGGHLLFYAIEAVRRRPVGPKTQEWAFRGGLAAILALMLVVTFNDLGRFGLWTGLAGLIG